MTEDIYAGFAGRYDRFGGDFGQHDPEQASFFRQLFARHGTRTILDCACGTGQHLHLFHTLGFQVTGSDISPAMLAQARKNLAGSGIEVPLHQVDYRTLPQSFTTVDVSAPNDKHSLVVEHESQAMIVLVFYGDLVPQQRAFRSRLAVATTTSLCAQEQQHRGEDHRSDILVSLTCQCNHRVTPRKSLPTALSKRVLSNVWVLSPSKSASGRTNRCCVLGTAGSS